MKISELFLILDGIIWFISGFAWHFFPNIMSKNLNNVSNPNNDITRGFGLALMLTGLVEILLYNESKNVIKKVTIARLLFVISIILGFIFYNYTTFINRPGFYGILLSSILPIIILLTIDN